MAAAATLGTCAEGYIVYLDTERDAAPGSKWGATAMLGARQGSVTGCDQQHEAMARALENLAALLRSSTGRLYSEPPSDQGTPA